MTRFEQELPLATYSMSRRTLLAHGIADREVRRPSWRRSSYGFYAAARPPDSPTPAQRILDALPLVPPMGALAGWAAAYVQGVDWLDGLNVHTLAPLPITVVLGSTVARGQHIGVRCVRHRLPAGDVVERHEVRVTSALRTTFDAMRLAPDLTEAVVAVDAALHFELVTLAEVEAYVAERRGWNGVGRARKAVDLADGQVLSTWESRLRTAYLIDAGLPRPLVNPYLLDASGRMLGRPDLFDPDAALAVEFDGTQHREREQHSRDNVREELLEDHGITVVRVDSIGLVRHRRGTVQRLRDGHRRGCARPVEQDRWRLA